MAGSDGLWGGSKVHGERSRQFFRNHHGIEISSCEEPGAADRAGAITSRSPVIAFIYGFELA